MKPLIRTLFTVAVSLPFLSDAGQGLTKDFAKLAEQREIRRVQREHEAKGEWLAARRNLDEVVQMRGSRPYFHDRAWRIAYELGDFERARREIVSLKDAFGVPISAELIASYDAEDVIFRASQQGLEVADWSEWVRRYPGNKLSDRIAGKLGNAIYEFRFRYARRLLNELVALERPTAAIFEKRLRDQIKLQEEILKGTAPIPR
ncbi:MAG: hypothetical protein JNJ45_05770 [Chthonomonas sp.]|nr:hypothetical protein [Chthonomonas sp.]